jgi:hypothetical protein
VCDLLRQHPADEFVAIPCCLHVAHFGGAAVIREGHARADDGFARRWAALQPGRYHDAGAAPRDLRALVGSGAAGGVRGGSLLAAPFSGATAPALSAKPEGTLERANSLRKEVLFDSYASPVPPFITIAASVVIPRTIINSILARRLVTFQLIYSLVGLALGLVCMLLGVVLSSTAWWAPRAGWSSCSASRARSPTPLPARHSSLSAS